MCHTEDPYADCRYSEGRGAFVPHQPLLPRPQNATIKCSTHVDSGLTDKSLVPSRVECFIRIGCKRFDGTNTLAYLQ
jgi:hypothetical protein